MDQELIWLSISLFCNKKNWNRLMSDGITAFLALAPNLIANTIEFNYLSGENIRLALLVNKTQAPAMAQNADEYFKRYFATSGLTVKPVKLPAIGVFMPFMANTIQYGLYPPQTIAYDEVEKHQTAIDLSAIMMEALQDEIDDETILTFAFYLQMGLIKSVYKHLKDVEDLFAIKYDFAGADNYKDDEDLSSSYSSMDEITVDVIETEYFEPELNWMNSWIKQCDIALNMQIENSDKTTWLKHFFIGKISAINRRLGINANAKNLLNHLTDRSLRQYFMANDGYKLSDGKN